ncbi:uncharacterized protein [Montipora foliosa]|uniref:uncharacterized protein n=1 Tax=Montipora foliosa TaxID=591990 RepID=UPI0035F15B4A
MLPQASNINEESDTSSVEGEIASNAPLYHSTPQPKAKRVCRVPINTSDSSSSDESSNISPVEGVTAGNVSSSSSVEGEIAPLVFKANVYKSMLPQSSNINEESDTSSVEGEIYNVVEETIGKQQPLPNSQDRFASLGDVTTSATSVIKQTSEVETPKMGTRRRALFSDTESEFEDFEGFDARDTRPCAKIASNAKPLYHSTPQPKAKRVCRVPINTSDSSSSDESSNISPVEDVTAGNVSSSSSVEGEIAPLVFEANVSKSMLPQASNINEESDTSSVEGEIYNVVEEIIGKQQPLPVSQDRFTSLGDVTTSATSVLKQTSEDKTPKMGSRRRALFSDTESEFEDFEGFDARDTRPCAEIASNAPLNHSTPQPKAKRVCRVPINTSDSSSSDESSNISPVEGVTAGNVSSSSSVEGEIAPLVFKANVYKSMLPQSSNINEESDTSSVEGEIYNVVEETIGKQQPLPNSQDRFASLGDVTTSATSVLKQTSEDKTPKMGSRRRGKHRSTVSTPEELTKETCCQETFCLQKLLSVSQMKKSRENFCHDYPTYELQRQFLFNWLDDNQPTAGVFRYYISGIKVCWSAWTKVLGFTRRRFFELKREFLLGRRSARHGASLKTKDCPQS